MATATNMTTAPHPDGLFASRRRAAEVTSGLGAFVLGVGIVGLLGGTLGKAAPTIIAAGLLAHGWGMYDRRRIDRKNRLPDLWWSSAAYWLCWLLLGGLAVWVAMIGFALV